MSVNTFLIDDAKIGRATALMEAAATQLNQLMAENNRLRKELEAARSLAEENEEMRKVLTQLVAVDFGALGWTAAAERAAIAARRIMRAAS